MARGVDAEAPHRQFSTGARHLTAPPPRARATHAPPPRHFRPGFESAFAAFLATKREASEDVDAAVRAIIAQVREHGDKAVIELTRRFDRLDLAARACG